MNEVKRVPAKRKKKPLCLECGKPTTGGAAYCSSECELKALRTKVVEQEERLARIKRKKDPVKCYGRVVWATCVQEWYTKASFDAKRRALELRALGFECTAQSIGNMPILHDGASAEVKMTVVTCAYSGDKNVPPQPEMIDGLAIDSSRRR